jgi:peroxiredoxin
MNKLLILLFTALFAGCFGGRTRFITGLEGKPLPQFTMLLTDSSSQINTSNITTGEPFILFYFSPNCPYCKAQTEELKEDIKDFGNTHIYFISTFPIHKIKKYEEQFGLSKYKNITTAQVNDSSFSKFYHASGVPYTVVYDKNKILKEVLLGKVSTSDIKSAAFDN